MKTQTRTANSTKANNSPKALPSLPLTTEEIRQRAHRIYLTRGNTPGNELEDWLRAEKELKAERTGTKLDAPQK